MQQRHSIMRNGVDIHRHQFPSIHPRSKHSLLETDVFLPLSRSTIAVGLVRCNVAIAASFLTRKHLQHRRRRCRFPLRQLLCLSLDRKARSECSRFIYYGIYILGWDNFCGWAVDLLRRPSELFPPWMHRYLSLLRQMTYRRPHLSQGLLISTDVIDVVRR